MQNERSRRQFLKTAAAGALAAKAFGMFGTCGASAAELAPQASNMPRLLAGCCAYSYAAELKSGQMTLEDFIARAVELRLDGVDITTYYLKSIDPAYLNSLRHLAYRQAVAISGVSCGVTMADGDPGKRTGVVNEIKKWVDVTEQLGASHLRVFAGKLPPGATTQQAIDSVVETMKAACDYSAQKGIMLGMEDHPTLVQSASLCLQVMQRVQSQYAGINLDITHFIPTPAQDAYAQIAACIPYATNVHIRDVFDDHTPVDLDRVWALFAHAGFKGYMSAEYDPRFAGDPVSSTGVPKLIAAIRALCTKYSSV